ncbi:MAG: fused MFS/spermidine synthase [Methylococcales bacterium]|nr:fused MFS/spermidine synthase [Methylococcales bacterium]
MNPNSQRNFSLILLFAFTLFISASLMFVVQPMFGKTLLPLLGGSPAVWNTCMVFYQTILFLGYLYAHTLTSQTKQHRQIQIHAAVIMISFLALPVALPENIIPPTESNPTGWLMWVLLLAIGLPFFVVSTTSTLLQKWFANMGHDTSHDPYYLYAASNSGSLLALLSYPFLIEPTIGLATQKIVWSGGYVFLCLLILACAALLWQSSKQEPVTETIEPLEPKIEVETETLTLYRQIHWGLLAFVPSSLLLGLTNFISTDIASVPLLWIIPLTLFLLTFVLVFSSWADKIHPLMVSFQPVVLLPFIAYSFINPALLPYWLDLLLHLLAFFLAVMVCHGELAKSRPSTAHLTTFYLIMSFAGMLGGMFNTFIAPFIFNAVYEYPIMIVAALLLRPGVLASDNLNVERLKRVALQGVFPLLVFIVGLSIYTFVDDFPNYLDSIGGGLILFAGLTYAFRKQAVTLALLTGTLLFFSIGLHSSLSHTLYQKRSFFGVFSVREAVLRNETNQPEKYHELFHGTTKHGAQRLPSHLKQIPLTYYSRPGPMGQLFKAFDTDNNQWVIGSVGLGAGALACYAKPQQNWTFYEIDPLVVDIAKNPKYFDYLSLCAKNATMRIGDARLSLKNEPAEKFDLLILDAFSSDSVPIHLLTQEAMGLYFDKLKPTGILAFHITNRHLEIKKVIADHAKQLKLAALIQEFKPKNPAPLVVATDWVVMAKDPKTLARLDKNGLGHWQKLPLYFNMKPWTDDFTNILDIWK